MLKKIITAVLFFFSLSLFAQQTDSVQRPKLIVTIAVDGLRSDVISLLWNELSSGGLRRMIREGSYCRNMSFPYWSVGDVPDYATVYSGTIPSDHSICSDSYWDPKTRKEMSYLYDADRKGVNTSTRISPKNLVTSTFTDELKLNTLGKSKIITVAINPQEAVVMAGHGGNGTVWIDDETGQWVSSSYYGNTLPTWAQRENMFNRAQEFTRQSWSNFYMSSQYKTTSSQSRSSSMFIYPLSEYSGKALPYSKFKESPFVNTMIREMAMKAIKDEYVGIDENPDVVNMQFSVRGFNQATTGVLTAEIEDSYYRLDKEIKSIQEDLDKICGVGNVLYVVYSTQTEYANPDFLKAFNVPSGYFVVDRSLSLLNTFLMATYGQGDFVHSYSNRQLFLDKEEIASKKLDIKEVEQKVAEFMSRFQGVQYAFRAEELTKLGNSCSRIQLIKNAFNPHRAGDIIMYMQPGWVAVPNEDVKIGLSTRINNYAPLIMSGWRVKHQTIGEDFSAIDIAPTICNMLRIAYPNFSTGSPLRNIID